MPATLVFDIETVPDVAGYRALFELDSALADADVAEIAFQRRRAASGQDFLPLHLQRVVAIACLLRERDQLRVWSLGAAADGEGELIQRFYDGVEKYSPQLVSWNGGGFDLPVLHYRGLVHGVVAPRYWDLGEGDFADSRDFRYNNYIGRYHTRHVDLMDLLSLYQPRASVPLDQLARLLGLPGKLGLEGSQVWEAFRSGRIAEIRDYCETDVANTWLVYLRFQMMRGTLDRDEHRRELELARATLGGLDAPHWRAFLARWSDRGR
jgi:predicted PolB exonuclease-like 3'-5' exonuclease